VLISLLKQQLIYSNVYNIRKWLGYFLIYAHLGPGTGAALPPASVGRAPGITRPVGDFNQRKERLCPASGNGPVAGEAGGFVSAARKPGRGDGAPGLPAPDVAAGGRGRGSGGAEGIQGYARGAGPDSPGQRLRLPGLGLPKVPL